VLLKGAALDERLYVPEPFRSEFKEEIGCPPSQEAGVAAVARRCRPVQDGHRRRRVQRLESTTFGRRISVRHMPDVSLCIEGKTWDRVERSYGAILQARDADVAWKPRVMMAALIYAKREQVYQVDTISMMLTTDPGSPWTGCTSCPSSRRSSTNSGRS
jgi:hypothetical protein